MTALVALGPLALTPVLVLLLMEFGPERSVLTAAYWLVPSIIFAIAMPLIRRRGRSRMQASLRAAVWALAITVALFVGLFFGFTPRVGATVLDSQAATQRADTGLKSPAAGSATRTALLDAVRAKLGVTARFKVTFIRANEQWAFVRCVEVVADGADLQETDLDVAALLHRRNGAKGVRWEVVDVWSLSTDDERPYTPFARRVRQRAKDDRLPHGLFPAGFLTSDVPVQ